jgi:hypothetical protein
VALEIGQCPCDVVGVAKSLMAVGKWNTGPTEYLPAAALRPAVDKVRIAAVNGNAQLDRERAFLCGHIEAGHVRRHRVGDHRANALHHIAAREDLLGQ